MKARKGGEARSEGRRGEQRERERGGGGEKEKRMKGKRQGSQVHCI